MLKILNNPKTENYRILKKKILDSEFPWYYQHQSTIRYPRSAKGKYKSHPLYSHSILMRGDAIGCGLERYNTIESSIGEFTLQVVSDIILSNEDRFDDNGHKGFIIMRMNINSSFPIDDDIQFTVPHFDHQFPHKNFICYLTEGHGGGRTFIKGHPPVEPVEDQCILFEGEHYMELPCKGRRIIIVGTMITY